MKLAHWIAVAGALASALPAHAATTDPIMLVYRVAGAENLGTANETTVFTCTSFSAVTESIEIVLRDGTGNIVLNAPQNIMSLTTFTSNTLALNAPDFVGLGALSIGSTTASISCTVWDFNNGPTVPLHMQRYNPIPNTLE
jgi:hypothetical protein